MGGGIDTSSATGASILVLIRAEMPMFLNCWTETLSLEVSVATSIDDTTPTTTALTTSAIACDKTVDTKAGTPAALRVSGSVLEILTTNTSKETWGGRTGFSWACWDGGGFSWACLDGCGFPWACWAERGFASAPWTGCEFAWSSWIRDGFAWSSWTGGGFPEVLELEVRPLEFYWPVVRPGELCEQEVRPPKFRELCFAFY